MQFILWQKYLEVLVKSDSKRDQLPEMIADFLHGSATVPAIAQKFKTICLKGCDFNILQILVIYDFFFIVQSDEN